MSGRILNLDPYMHIIHSNETTGDNIYNFLDPNFTKLVEDNKKNNEDIFKLFKNLYKEKSKMMMEGLSILFLDDTFIRSNNIIHLIFVGIGLFIILHIINDIIYLPIKRKNFSKYKNNKLARFSMPYNIIFMSTFHEPYNVLETTIQSILSSNYENKKLLLCIVCDGIISETNTGSIQHVLKIMGIENPDHDESIIYRSIGRGRRQMN